MGPEVIAALGIGFSALEGFTWPCYHGVSLAVSSFVGRYIGAGKPHLAKRVVRQTIPLSAALGLSFGAVFLIFGSPLTALFTSDDAVHQQAILYTQIIGYSQIFVAMEALFEGAMMGAGTTKAMFWLSAPLNFLRIPIAWYFGVHLGYGASGIRWAVTSTSILKACLKGGYIWRFPWAESRV
jgi:MATE family multidrug resistance protein